MLEVDLRLKTLFSAMWVSADDGKEKSGDSVNRSRHRQSNLVDSSSFVYSEIVGGGDG